MSRFESAGNGCVCGKNELNPRSIAFVTGNFPSPAHPYRGAFVQELVYAVAEGGVQCTVIHPWKAHQWLRERRSPGDGGGRTNLRVLRPLTVSISNRQLGPMNTFELTHRLFRVAALRALRSLPALPDAIYGHFLYPAGATAVWAAAKLGRPGFVAVGEGTFWTLEPLGLSRARRDFSGATGVIAVSSLLRNRLVEEVGIPPEKIAVLPNGVDRRRFYPRDRFAMRDKYRLPKTDFLVIYVGNFIESKGVSRVAEAIDGLPGVSGIFVGSGPLPPKISNVAFCGRVPHEQVPELMSAADCFVLPSDVEGSSNASIEAMACGVPAVVSDGAYNDDTVGDSGLRVPYADVAALRRAITALQSDKALRESLSAKGLRRAEHLDIRQRAESLLRFMAERIAASR